MQQIASNVGTVFDGTQFYWRTRNSVDVVIVHHKHERVYEVIVYEPGMGMEAPRLYVDEIVLMRKVDQNEIDSKVSFAKRNEVPMTEKFLIGVVNKAVADFILNHLVILELVALEQAFVVGLRIDDCDAVPNPAVKELMCICPEALVAHQTKHYKQLMQGAVVAVMEALEEDKKILRESCELAVVMSARVVPTVRDRWRMPLVLNKVFRGARLCFNDTKVFENIQSNLKSDECVARMKSAMRKTSRVSPRSMMGRELSSLQKRSQGAPEPHSRSALDREPSCNQRAKAGPEAPLRTTIVREKSCQKGLGECAGTHATQQKQRDVSSQCAADGIQTLLQAEVGALKKTPSSSRFDTVSSRSKAASQETAAFTARSSKSLPKSRRPRQTFRLSSKPQYCTNDLPRIEDGTPEAASQISDGSDHEDATATHSFSRVMEGLAALGASLCSSFQLGASYNIGKIEEGCEKPASANLLAALLPSVPVPSNLLAALLPSVERRVEAEALHDAIVAAESYMTDSDADDALDSEFEAPIFEVKSKPKSYAYLGSFLFALVSGRSGEAAGVPPLSRQGSNMSSSMYSWMSSKKVLPAQ